MYVTASEVETFMGISHTDLKVAGRTMEDAEWIQFVKDYQVPIANMIHVFCRVPTFDPTASNSLVVDIKSGRNATEEEIPYVRGSTGVYGMGRYLPNDVEFYLKHLYFTGTIGAIDYDPVLVEVDTAPDNAIESWATRVPRSSIVAGDYRVITQDELTMVRFHTNVPRFGFYNIRMTYTTGYDPSSEQFKAIKLIVLRCFKNFVMLKKKLGEPFTIRAHGVRDFQTMFEPFDESQILSDAEKAILEPYRRFPLAGEMFD